MKKLQDLISTSLDIEISGITEDSRYVQEGYLFVATKGYYVDHYDYIEDAIKRGCVFLVVDREITIEFPHIVVDDINSFYGLLCKKYYDVDFSSFFLIGITGTDGKTTTASIVRELLDDCAYIGTNGLILRDKTYSLSNTTPCISELYECFFKIQKEHFSTVVMEVSSEALLHHRVDSLQFDMIAFTNITEDHLMVHKSFDNYVQSKLHLLDFLKEDGKVVVNGDDVHLQSIKCQNMYTFGKEVSNNCVISCIQSFQNKTKFSLCYHHEFEVESPLIGEYNVYNVTEAILISLLYGVDREVLLHRIFNLSPIKGRGERLDFGQKFTIVLDYAHTINGIHNILETYQNYSHIITVTGAAGGRDSYKRPIIGKMVMDYSDVSIFTMDDPRYEDVDMIIDEMVGEYTNYIRIPSREKAIFYALSVAREDSVVLILGKGRDSYMAIQDQKIPYNDYDVIKSFFQSFTVE